MLFSSRRRHDRAIGRYRQLRDVISDMSPSSAAAMLTGLETRGRAMCGTYGDGADGCPALLAFRHGAAVGDLRFAKAWDLFCNADRQRDKRYATAYELDMLRLLLEEKLMPAEERRRSPMPQIAPVTLPVETPVSADRDLILA